MEILYRWIDGINDVLWSYLLVALLLGCAVWFTLRTRGVQFRMLGEMVRVLGESAGSGPRGEKHVSSFQAFAVSLASRVGTGNLAGVATAIVVGGPGAVFWMWVIALVGAASAFVESTLAQLYKRRGRDSFIGGPAYYIHDFMTKKKTLREKHVRDSVSLPSDIEALQAEILRLKSELTKAEIKAEAYDEMINVAESELGISIRKKSGAKQ